MLLLLVCTSILYVGEANAGSKFTLATSHYEQATDEELMLENWMTNDCYWKCMKNNCLVRDYDEMLTLEAWMKDVASWELALLIPVETEKALEVESWMTNDLYWETKDTRQGIVLADESGSDFSR